MRVGDEKQRLLPAYRTVPKCAARQKHVERVRRRAERKAQQAAMEAGESATHSARTPTDHGVTHAH